VSITVHHNVHYRIVLHIHGGTEKKRNIHALLYNARMFRFFCATLD